MDLISKRRAKNAQARHSCAVLLAVYCLFALFTSLPAKTTEPVALAIQPVAMGNKAFASNLAASSLPALARKKTTADHNKAAQQSTTIDKQSPYNWWDQHKYIALVRGKWGQQHQAKSPKPTNPMAPLQTLDLPKIANLWVDERPYELASLLFRKKLPLGVPLQEPTITQQKTPPKTQKPVLPRNDKLAVSTEPVTAQNPVKKPLEKDEPSSSIPTPHPAEVTKPAAEPVQLLVLTRVVKQPELTLEQNAAPQPVVPRSKARSITKTERLTTTTHASLPPLTDLPPSPRKRQLVSPDPKPALASLTPVNERPSLSPPVKSTLPDRKLTNQPLESDFEALVPKTLFAYFKSLQNPDPPSPAAAHCVADKIAGWSGTKLLPRHEEIIKEKSAPSTQISIELAARLAMKGFTPGTSIFMRIFKDKSELEIWLKKGERYALYHTYKICRWSGSFGPKLYEGDKQSPEGFYTVNRQLFTRPSWKWKGSFSIGYPNAYDKLHGRTGSLILVHGGCTSSGCFAMTDPVINEVRELAQLARDNGQTNFNVHVYPFKLTTANLEKHKDSPWMPFWNNLKEGYDLFEKTGLPARVRVCNKRYVFSKDGEEHSQEGWSGKGCYGLAAYIPGWKPASRYAKKRSARQSRRANRRAGCNLKRASCRKFVALKRKKTSKRSRKVVRKKRLSKKRRLASKRRATMRRARAIGRKRAYKPFPGAGNR